MANRITLKSGIRRLQARKSTADSAAAAGSVVEASVATVSWIDAEAPAGSHVCDPRPPGKVEGYFFTTPTENADPQSRCPPGYRFSNYLSVRIKSDDGVHVTDASVLPACGMHRSPSAFGLSSKAFEPRSEQNRIEKDGIEGVEFSQLVGARTISAGVLGGAAGDTLGGIIGADVGVTVANQMMNFPPIWTRLRLRVFANGDREGELLEHSLFPSCTFYQDGALVSEYDALADEQKAWEDKGWKDGNPWVVARPTDKF